ncbi:MAG: hypothetical protein IPI67_29990 [Myxococcales bacterium]|nr:hypothetical protein [Myxococcales bacterium]
MKLLRVLVVSCLFAARARADLAPVVAHPEPPPRVFPRRMFELATHGAGAASECAQSCNGLTRVGFGAGFTALLRPLHGIAFLYGIDRSWFRWSPDGRETFTAHVTTRRVGMRGYVLETENLDGWLEAVLIKPSWGASTEVDSPGPGAGLGTGAGVEMYLREHLKLGARAQFDVFGEDGGPHEGGGTSAATGTTREAPLIRLVFQLGLTVTIPFGPKLAVD